MLSVCGHVSRSQFGVNRETGEVTNYFEFNIEGMPLMLGDSLTPEMMPRAGESVVAVVNRVWSNKKSKEFYIILGFSDSRLIEGSELNQLRQMAYSAPVASTIPAAQAIPAVANGVPHS